MQYWKNEVVKSDLPPDDALLKQMGEDGYELACVIYSEVDGQWLSYFKTLIDPVSMDHESSDTSDDIDEIPF